MPMQRQLTELFAGAKLPTSPALALRILELSRDPDASIKDFAQIITTDPALTGRLLQAANAAEAGQSRKVATLERAVGLLGLRRVKSLALGFQLIAHLDKIGGASFDMMRFWQQSLLRGCTARAIADSYVPALSEQAFLAGLLQDCGVPLLVQVLGGSYASLVQSNHLSPSSLFELEQASFPYTHVDAAAALLGEWGLPPEITLPIAGHHQAPPLDTLDEDVARLHAVSYVVGNLCFEADQLRSAADLALPEYSASVFGFDDATWDRVQRGALDEYQRGAAIFAGKVSQEVDVVDLLGEANKQLSCVADQNEASIFDLKAEQERILGTHQRVAKSLREYRERAALDPLTGLLNRGALAETMRTMMDHSQNQPAEFSVAFMDIDDFKKVNDELGHTVGDEALKAVAEVLRLETDYGAVVARFGGEEFLLIYSGASLESLRATGDRILTRVRGLDLSSIGLTRPVTCSIGVAWTDLVSTRSAEDMIAHADELMYRAKRDGKNRVCYQEYHAADMPIELLQQVVSAAVAQSPEAGMAHSGAENTLDELVAVAARISDCDSPRIVGLRKEVRGSVFVPCRVELLAHIDEALCFEVGVIRDYSTGGAGVVMGRPLVRGESVEVTFGEGSDRQSYRGMVSFCRPAESRFYHVGVQFVPKTAGGDGLRESPLLEHPAAAI